MFVNYSINWQSLETMSLEEDLLRDLDSDSDGEEEVEVQGDPAETTEKPSVTQDDEGDVQMDGVGDELTSLAQDGKEVGTEQLISRIDMNSVNDVTKFSKLATKLRPIMESIDDFMSKMISKKNEYDFLIKTNNLTLEITNEQTMLHSFVKTHYQKRFPALESLLPDVIEYAKTVKILQNDIDNKEADLPFLSKEKKLVIAMDAIDAKTKTVALTEQELEKVISACDLLIELQEDKSKIEHYMASRLAAFAPNLSAIVGPHTAAQLMSSVGGLAELVATPSCNIAALGNKRTVGIGLGYSGIRQQGYLFYSDLIQQVPDSLKRKAMRIAAGKLILAARVDHSGSSPDGALGRKWSQEIATKIEKLEEPPEVAATKALPIPEDKKAKKRGGRRYRKLKAKFELSELRKAQDRVEFGKREDTVMDSYGEEIGLGMMGSLSHIPTNTLNKANVSKAMRNRLEKSNADAQELFSQDFINIPRDEPKAIDGPSQKKIKR